MHVNKGSECRIIVLVLLQQLEFSPQIQVTPIITTCLAPIIIDSSVVVDFPAFLFDIIRAAQKRHSDRTEGT
jgi:hypothetical protein